MKTYILYSYLIIKAEFLFPPSEGTKYTSIPCYVVENGSVYTLRGCSVFTGSEYLLAKYKNVNFICMT